MNLPTPHPLWHGFAHGLGVVFRTFAMGRLSRHCFSAGQGLSGHGARSQRCYPSPSLRSGPSQAGPILMRGPSDDCAGRLRNCFQIRDVALESGAITTNHRGSIPCASRLSSSLFSLPLWPAACRTRRRAAWLARRLAPWSPMRWMKTCWPGPLWAAWPALQPVASSWACRPATQATDLAAYGRFQLTRGTIRAARPGGPFAFPLGGADV